MSVETPGSPGRKRESDEMPRKMQIRAWRPLVKNTLRGFATIELPIGLVITDITVHIKNDREWASLPAKAQIDRDGGLRVVEGKIQYSKVLEWRNRDLSDRFSAALVAALDMEYPDWRGQS